MQARKVAKTLSFMKMPSRLALDIESGCRRVVNEAILAGSTTRVK
jgi:hypothetical protein